MAVQLVREVANLAVEVAEVSETAKEWEEWKEHESLQSPRRSRDDKMELGASLDGMDKEQYKRGKNINSKMKKKGKEECQLGILQFA